MDVTPTVTNESERQRYVLRLGEQELGFIDYDLDGTGALRIKHTEVAQGHDGKGYGSALVRGMLDDVRAQHGSVVPLCPFVTEFIRRNRQYVDLVRDDMRSRV